MVSQQQKRSSQIEQKEYLLFFSANKGDFWEFTAKCEMIIGMDDLVVSSIFKNVPVCGAFFLYNNIYNITVFLFHGEPILTDYSGNGTPLKLTVHSSPPMHVALTTHSYFYLSQRRNRGIFIQLVIYQVCVPVQTSVSLLSTFPAPSTWWGINFYFTYEII